MPGRDGIEILDWTSPHFPESLKRIPKPPALLYVKGNWECLTRPEAVAVVGTRTPTTRGLCMSRLFGRWLGQRKIVVVSGLALGCDAAAHEGCLEARGQTVAVLPGGIRRIYPPQHHGLADRILKASGCLLSEYPPDEPPQSCYFVERDRLQSGLSGALVVAETDIRGGAMHTARFCRQEKKPLACLDPGKKYALNPMLQGNLKLIRRHQAVPLKGMRDLEIFLSKLSNHQGASAQ